MQEAPVESGQALTFAGTREERRVLDEVYPKISQAYDIKLSEEDHSEPQLYGGGTFARGWRQMQVFDPDFQPFD